MHDRTSSHTRLHTAARAGHEGGHQYVRTGRDALFQGYQATVDWPGCTFYAELMRRYPEAKVVLSVRDPERWYESARQTIYYVRQAFPRWMPLFFPRMRGFHRMLDRLVWDGMFQGRFEDKAFAIEVFNRYNEQVRRVVPPDRLLVYEVREGWEPLCAFLGVPVPEGKPFPHVNDTAEFRSRIQRGARIVRTVGYTVVTDRGPDPRLAGRPGSWS